MISSSADAERNSLATGTLSFSDIQNQSHYSANSSGISAGVGIQNTGKAIGPGSTPGGAIPTFASENGDENATTRSAVSAGTITITDQAAQTQDVSTLSRDTTNTNGTVSAAPDVNAILNEQADTMQAAQAAGQVVAQGIGTYATMKKTQADAAAKAAWDAGDVNAYNAAVAESKSWSEGGSNRIALHIAGGALLGGLGGGSIGTALQGAAGAGLSSGLATQLDSLSKGIADSTGSTLLGSLVSNVVAGAGGALVGGGTGAFTAANADLYNRQLHPDEYALAKKNAKVVANQLGISVEEAEGRIVAEILRNSDKQTADASGGVHDWEVRGIIGCQNLNCDGYKNDPYYADHNYNSQYIGSNQDAYNVGQQQLGTGLSDAGLRDQNIVYERTGKAAIAATACLLSGGVACKAAATGLGVSGFLSFVTNQPLTTAEAIGGLYGGAVGGVYGGNLNAWAGEASRWYEKVVLGITTATPAFAGKQVGVPLGNATGLGGSVDPLVDPNSNSWWGYQNVINKFKGSGQ